MHTISSSSSSSSSSIYLVLVLGISSDTKTRSRVRKYLRITLVDGRTSYNYSSNGREDYYSRE